MKRQDLKRQEDVYKRQLGGLDIPTKGSVTLAGKDLYRMKEDALAVFRRRKIGFVFQEMCIRDRIIPHVNQKHSGLRIRRGNESISASS